MPKDYISMHKDYISMQKDYISIHKGYSQFRDIIYRLLAIQGNIIGQ